MTRRALFLVPLAACCGADASQEVLDLFTNLAAALSASNVKAFMSAFDPAMPGYARLREHVTGLSRQGDVESFVDVVSEEGDTARRTVELDWRMRIRREDEATAAPGRDGLLKCRLEKQGRKWRITSLEPVDFFAP